MISNVKKWVVAIAIAIVLNLFVNYGIATFYSAPEYDHYCPNDPYPREPVKPDSCEPIVPTADMQQNCNEKKGYIAYNRDSEGCATDSYCETCSADFDQARERYEGNVFVILLLVSVLTLFSGLKLNKESVSSGLLLAGILGLLIASTRYWPHLQDVYRFLLLGIVLAILIWLGYKKTK